MFTFKMYSSMVEFDENAGVRIARAGYETLTALLLYPNPEQKKILPQAVLNIHIVGHGMTPDRTFWQTEILLRLESSNFRTRNMKLYHYYNPSYPAALLPELSYISNKNTSGKVDLNFLDILFEKP